jgi:hypothetical protein
MNKGNNMNDQAPNPVQIQLNGGVYPNEDGTWRVCCWLSGIKSEAEAKNVSEWLAKLLQANIRNEPPPVPQ